MHLGVVAADAATGDHVAHLLSGAGAAEVRTCVLSLTGDLVADRVALDAALDSVHGRRVALALEAPALAAVLHRMTRRGEIETTETALVGPRPASLARLGLPAKLADAARLAVEGRARTVGLLKDDSGGILIDSARLVAWPGRAGGRPGPFWLRAYVDDEPVSDGMASSLSVERVDRGVLRAVATRPGVMRRRHAVEGRALQLACDDALIVSDGVPRERPRDKRTWWCEPDFWRVALPSP